MKLFGSIFAFTKKHRNRSYKWLLFCTANTQLCDFLTINSFIMKLVASIWHNFFIIAHTLKYYFWNFEILNKITLTTTTCLVPILIRADNHLTFTHLFNHFYYFNLSLIDIHIPFCFPYMLMPFSILKKYNKNTLFYVIFVNPDF
jgi:hypothetical protein